MTKLLLSFWVVVAAAAMPSAAPLRNIDGHRQGIVETHWPNGRLRSRVQYADDVYHGEYRTWSIDGRPYELKHFAYGRETATQQAWDERGELYLNYEVKDGRKYGLANAKPCLPAGAM